MGVYIKSTGIISPQQIQVDDTWLDKMVVYNSNLIRCIEPIYKDLIQPIHLRKMPRILKIGLYASMLCINNANKTNIDAILIGTGLGCLEELEKFLNQIIDNNEQNLFPGSFINSTHNFIGAQIASMTNNNKYNINYIHRNFSFENALIDSLMLIEDNEAKNLLVGCIDEITDYHFKIYGYLNYWKPDDFCNKDLFLDKYFGSIAGEGSAFYVLSSEKTSNCPEIIDVSIFYKPKTFDEISMNINLFLEKAGVSPENIDILISGNNGDFELDKTYNEIINEHFSLIPVVFYKHLCGEYYTASGFALGIAWFILKYQKVPSSLIISKKPKKDTKNILIYNKYRNNNHSLILAGIS